MTNSTNDATTRTGHLLTLAAGVAVVLGLLAAAVILGAHGWVSADILGLLTGLSGIAGALVAAIGSIVDLKAATDQQTQVLKKIDHQTNGGLDARIDARADARIAAAMDAPIPYKVTDK